MYTKTFKVIKASNKRRQETWGASSASVTGKKIIEEIVENRFTTASMIHVNQESIIITCRERQFKPI